MARFEVPILKITKGLWQFTLVLCHRRRTTGVGRFLGLGATAFILSWCKLFGRTCFLSGWASRWDRTIRDREWWRSMSHLCSSKGTWWSCFSRSGCCNSLDQEAHGFSPKDPAWPEWALCSQDQATPASWLSRLPDQGTRDSLGRSPRTCFGTCTAEPISCSALTRCRCQDQGSGWLVLHASSSGSWRQETSTSTSHRSSREVAPSYRGTMASASILRTNS